MARAGYLAAGRSPILIVLDVMMPGMSGWDVCERLPKSNVPIIMLTAKGEEIDKLRGFRLGVDDCVTKPFSFVEMVARVAPCWRAPRARQCQPTASPAATCRSISISVA
jgi:DNA-binding response OmpR family regulator